MTTKTPPTEAQIRDYLASLPPDERESFFAEAAKRLSDKKKPAPRLTFSQFKAKFWRNYRPAPYDDAIDKVLMGVADYVLSEGAHGIKKALILAPPRHGKTMRVSRLFPAWMLSQMPNLPMITASYGTRLAEKNSRWVRNLLERRDYQEAFPHVMLAPGSKASDQWETTQEGGMLAAGIGSALTGFGALLGIIDDPTRSRADAESANKRQTQKDWYTDDFLTRLEEPGGAQVVMATLWHTDDLPSWLLSSDEDEDDPTERWHVLRLPAIAEENDPLNRQPGEALWPERYPIAWLEKRKQHMGDYSFAAEYQQRPLPLSGGLIKTDLITEIVSPPVIKHKVRAWDLAMSEKTHADYTASVLMGEGEDGHTYILDVTRQRVDWSNLVEYMALIILQDSSSVQQFIERKGYMSRSIELLNADPRMRHFAIMGQDVDNDKVTRALPFASRVGAGMVHILNRHFLKNYLDELAVFPFGAHDDQVDATSLAYFSLSAGSGCYDGAVVYDEQTYIGGGYW